MRQSLIVRARVKSIRFSTLARCLPSGSQARDFASRLAAPLRAPVGRLVFARVLSPVALLLIAACGAPQRTTAEPPAASRSDPGAAGAGTQTVFGSTGRASAKALRGEIFDLPDSADKLPDFSTLRPTGAIFAEKFDVPNRAFDEGFPGVTSRFEWFALRFMGDWTPKAAGKWSFRLAADDGSKLLIDGKLVIDNDGVHGEQDVAGELELTAAPHRVELQYFQGPATQVALQLFVTPPAGTEHIWTVED